MGNWGQESKERFIPKSPQVATCKSHWFQKCKYFCNLQLFNISRRAYHMQCQQCDHRISVSSKRGHQCKCLHLFCGTLDRNFRFCNFRGWTVFKISRWQIGGMKYKETLVKKITWFVNHVNLTTIFTPLEPVWLLKAEPSRILLPRHYCQ